MIDDETWKFLQSTYEEIVNNDDDIRRSSLPPGGYLGMSSFYVPYRIDKGKHGRGIFATKDIPEGTMIWRSFQTARFETAKDYRKYIHQLYQLGKEDVACDVLQWAYTRMESRADGYTYVVACLDLDDGSLINECETDWECNLIVAAPRDSGCRMQFYSTRDIRAGEELRIDYGFSEMNKGWATMGLDKKSESLFGEEDDGRKPSDEALDGFESWGSVNEMYGDDSKDEL